MNATTIARISANAQLNKNTVIGGYTYSMDLSTGNVLRCKTSDIGRQWIGNDGNQFDGWSVVAHA